MKYLLINFFILMAIAQPVFSQSTTMEKNVAEMIKELKMSTAVEKKFISIYTEFGETMKVAKKNSTSKITLYSAYKTASAKRDKQMKLILTATRYRLYLTKQDELEKKEKANKS